MTTIAEIAAAHIAEIAALDPIAATLWGIPDFDDRLPDLSPGGLEARAECERRTLSALGAIAPTDAEERIAAGVMRERLEASLALYDAGEEFRSIRVLAQPAGLGAAVLRPHARVESDVGLGAIAAPLLAGVPPNALEQLRRHLRAEGISPAPHERKARCRPVRRSLRRRGRAPRRSPPPRSSPASSPATRAARAPPHSAGGAERAGRAYV